MHEADQYGFYFFVTGSHITLVAHSKAVGLCLEAANELIGQGIECEVNLYYAV